MSQKFEEILNQSEFNGYKYGEWRPVYRYQHIERLGHLEVDGLLNGVVYIQTKIDGANLTVCSDPKVGTIICSRRNVKAAGDSVRDTFNGAYDYVFGHKGLVELSKEYILRGEWMKKHTIRYPEETMHKLWIFDVQRYNGSYLTPEEYIPLLEAHEILYILPIAKLSCPTPELLIPYTEGPDEFGAEQKEGVVIKRYDFVNKFGRTKWAKLISKDFKEKNKLVMGSNRKDDIELQFATNVISSHDVLKVIADIRNRDNGITIKKMAEVLGRCYNDIMTEELWNFVHKKKVKQFDFGKVRYYCEGRIREIALDYFNGITNGSNNLLEV